MTKRVLVAEGLPTPQHVLLKRGAYSNADVAAAQQKLGLPLIVKPAREGSSIGLTTVTQAAQMLAAVEQAAQLDADVLCEQFIAGDEVTCPVLGTGSAAYALPVIRITAVDGNYDYQNKYFTDTRSTKCPAACQKVKRSPFRPWFCKPFGRSIAEAGRGPT